MKHTNGAWFAVEYAGHYSIQYGPYYGDTDLLDSDSVGEEKAELNALVCAAAPLLLAACEEFIREVECGEAKSTKSYNQMKEAVSKTKKHYDNPTE